MSKVIVFGSLNMDLSIESDHMPQLGETIMGRPFHHKPWWKRGESSRCGCKTGSGRGDAGRGGSRSFRGSDDRNARRARSALRFDRARGCSPNGVAVITRVSGDNFITIDPGANLSGDLTYVEQVLKEEAQAGDVFLCQLECDFRYNDGCY